MKIRSRTDLAATRRRSARRRRVNAADRARELGSLAVAWLGIGDRPAAAVSREEVRDERAAREDSTLQRVHDR
jgi:hypothetical protein